MVREKNGIVREREWKKGSWVFDTCTRHTSILTLWGGGYNDDPSGSLSLLSLSLSPFSLSPFSLSLSLLSAPLDVNFLVLFVIHFFPISSSKTIKGWKLCAILLSPLPTLSLPLSLFVPFFSRSSKNGFQQPWNNLTYLLFGIITIFSSSFL